VRRMPHGVVPEDGGRVAHSGGAVGWFGEVVEGVWGALCATEKASTVSSTGLPQSEARVRSLWPSQLIKNRREAAATA
jgi:hypothetical protein